MDAEWAPAELLIEGARELLTVPAEGGLGIVPDGVVAIAAGRILAAGDRVAVAAAVDLDGAERLDLDGGVLAPGFVDSHTHVVFGGTRVDEYAASVAHDTETMAQLRESGRTGIPATVAATRATPEAELIEQSAARVAEMVRLGTTTIESKSGYGLERATEIRQLEANAAIAERTGARIVSTFLGAHAVPPEMSRERYIEHLVADLIPEVAERGLASFCDVYCDVGYYTAAETERILRAGLDLGLRPKVHIDAYSHTGFASIAAEMGAVSADHLDYTTREEAEQMGRAGVVGVLMPGLDFAVAQEHPFDAPMLLDAGLPIALATDICPGCWMPSMALVIGLACRLHGLSVDTAVRAATRGGAAALDLESEVGSLGPGMAADLQWWDLPDHRDIAYRLGSDPVRLVLREGRIVSDRRDDTTDRP